MGFTPEQSIAIDAQGKVIVSASAGSGKTTVMIEKIIRQITSGVGVDEILAVTFTNKAAASMKEKLCRAIIEEINKPTTSPAKRNALKAQLALVPTADISTIPAIVGGANERGGGEIEGKLAAVLDHLIRMTLWANGHVGLGRVGVEHARPGDGDDVALFHRAATDHDGRKRPEEGRALPVDLGQGVSPPSCSPCRQGAG